MNKGRYIQYAMGEQAICNCAAGLCEIHEDCLYQRGFMMLKKGEKEDVICEFRSFENALHAAGIHAYIEYIYQCL